MNKTYQLSRTLFIAFALLCVPNISQALTYSNSYDGGGNLTSSVSTTGSSYAGTNSDGTHAHVDYGNGQINFRGMPPDSGNNNSGSGNGGPGGSSVPVSPPTAKLEACVSNTAGNGCVSGTRTAGTLTLEVNEKARFIWSTTNVYLAVNACNIVGIDSWLPSSGQKTVGITVPTKGTSKTYTLDCLGLSGQRAYDTVTLTRVSYPPVTSSLTACKLNSAQTGCISGTATGGTLGLKYNERPRFTWSSTNAYNTATACRIPGIDSTLGRAGSVNRGTNVPSAGSTQEYTAQCRNDGGWSTPTAASKVTVRRYTRPDVRLIPSVNHGCPAFISDCGVADVFLHSPDNLSFTWVVDGTDGSLTSCRLTDLATAGASLRSPNGTNVNVSEPNNGSSKDFRLSCSGPGGSIEENITVATLDPILTITPDDPNNPDPLVAVDLTVTPVLVHKDDPVTVTWEINPIVYDLGNCELLKNGTSMNGFVINSASGSVDIPVTSTATYQVLCEFDDGSLYSPQQSMEYTVNMIPAVYES